jgi:hypothetical protein
MAVNTVATSTRVADGRLTNKEIARVLYDVAEILEKATRGEVLF